MEKSKERHTVENNEKILSEALAYFHRSQVFRKLFLKFREKYISLGHFGGSVTLTRLTAEEKMALGGFLPEGLYEEPKRYRFRRTHGEDPGRNPLFFTYLGRDSGSIL